MSELRDKVAHIVWGVLNDRLDDEERFAVADRILALPEIAEALACYRPDPRGDAFVEKHAARLVKRFPPDA